MWRGKRRRRALGPSGDTERLRAGGFDAEGAATRFQDPLEVPVGECSTRIDADAAPERLSRPCLQGAPCPAGNSFRLLAVRALKRRPLVIVRLPPNDDRRGC